MSSGARLPLVGRGHVLTELDAILEEARTGHGGLVLLTGEPGIGKTRLATEAVRRTPAFRSVWSWCASDAATSSYRPWIQVIRELCAVDPPLAAEVAESPALRGLLAHVPAAAADTLDAEAVRWQLFDSVTDVLRRATRYTPVLVVLDDLHEAQESSLWLLAHLTPALSAVPALVLATVREGEQVWHDHLVVRATLIRQATSIRLGPLTEAHVRELMASGRGEATSVEQVSRILRGTRGNPLLVTEMLQSLVHADVPNGGVPDTVRVIAAERLSRLGAAARRLISAAAVLGTGCSLVVLRAMSGCDPHALGVEVAGMLEGDDVGGVRFVHELIRDAVYHGLPTEERYAWHARAAAVLQNLAEQGRDVDAAELAHHLLRAGPEAIAMGGRAAQAAGAEAMESLAFEEAAAWYQRALAAFESTGIAAEQRATLLIALGEARLACGEHDRARAAFFDAAAAARAAQAPVLLARAALGLGSGLAGFEVGLFDQQQLDLLEEARAQLGEDEAALLALVTARLSVAKSLLDSVEQRRALAEEAVRLAREAEDDTAQAYALAALCDAIAGPDDVHARLTHAAEIVERAARVRSAPLELLGRRLRVVAYLEIGDRLAAEREMARFRLRADAFRHPLYRWYVPLWHAAWALAEARFADCQALNAQVETQGREAGGENARMMTDTQRWCLYAALGDLEGLRALFNTLHLETVRGLWLDITDGVVRSELGDLEGARRRLDAIAPQLASLPRDSEWLASLSQVAETVARIGQHPIALWTYDALAPYAHLFAVEGIGAAIRGPVHRPLAMLARAMGQPQRADEHFARAIEAARGIGAPGLVDRIETERSQPFGTMTGDDSLGEGLFRRDGEFWTIRYSRREVRLRDSKGMRDLALLLTQPRVHVAALDLAGSRASDRAGGDGFEQLDAEARAAYRRRLVELEEAAADAEHRGDISAAHLVAERDALLEQLSAAYGLGGRTRRTGSNAERARSAVTARIREAVRRIEAAHPDLGRHLARSVRTGTFCVYEPDPPLRWRM